MTTTTFFTGRRALLAFRMLGLRPDDLSEVILGNLAWKLLGDLFKFCRPALWPFRRRGLVPSVACFLSPSSVFSDASLSWSPTFTAPACSIDTAELPVLFLVGIRLGFGCQGRRGAGSRARLPGTRRERCTYVRLLRIGDAVLFHGLGDPQAGEGFLGLGTLVEADGVVGRGVRQAVLLLELLPVAVLLALAFFTSQGKGAWPARNRWTADFQASRMASSSA